MNNETSRGARETWTPLCDNYGVQGQVRCFMEMKKFKQCLERRLECVY